MRRLGILLLLLCAHFLLVEVSAQQSKIIHLIFTSDLHFGLSKDSFRGEQKVTAQTVNEQMANSMGSLLNSQLPIDGLTGSGTNIEEISGIIVTGDIANRQEVGIQSAKQSWNQFQKVYLEGALFSKQLHPPIFCLLPGNHDVSNMVGYHKPMNPLHDTSSFAGIYQYIFSQTTQQGAKVAIQYPKDRIHYSKNFGGVHCIFLNLWPDSAEREWMEKDLASINPTTPVLLFAHSIPDVEARFFINPNDDHSINSKHKFENLLGEVFADGLSISDTTLSAQKAFASFLKRHPNIKGYFHGHVNYTEFYHWQAPDSSVHLPCIRVDSPMKGKYSSKDESRLSFELISIDMGNKKLVVRECLWNQSTSDSTKRHISFGSSFSFSL